MGFEWFSVFGQKIFRRKKTSISKKYFLSELKKKVGYSFCVEFSNLSIHEVFRTFWAREPCGIHWIKKTSPKLKDSCPPKIWPWCTCTYYTHLECHVLKKLPGNGTFRMRSKSSNFFSSQLQKLRKLANFYKIVFFFFGKKLLSHPGNKFDL